MKRASKTRESPRLKVAPPPPAPDPVKSASEAYELLIDVVSMTKALCGEMQMAQADLERGLGLDEETVEEIVTELRAILHLADATERVIRKGVIGEAVATAIHEENRCVKARRVLEENGVQS